MRRIVLGVLLTNTADGILLVALPLLLASAIETDSGLGLAIGITWAPAIAFGWLGGHMYDRFNSRSILKAVQGGRCLTVLVLGASLLGSDTRSLVLLAVFAGIVSNSGEWIVDNGIEVVVARTESGPGLSSRYGGLKSLEIASNRLIGPALGAPLYAWKPSLVLFLAAGLLISAAFVLPESAPEKRDGSKPNLWRLFEFADTTATVLVVAAISLGGGFTIGVLPRFASDQLGLPDSLYGVLIAGSAVGGVLGGALLAQFSPSMSAPSILRLGVAATGIMQFTFGQSTRLSFAFGSATLYGIAAAWTSANILAIRQGESPPEIRGLIGGFARSVSAAGLALGAVGGGVLAANFGLSAPWSAAAVVHLAAVAGLFLLEHRFPQTTTPKLEGER